ncbi:MAG: agmatinase family protein [Rhodospirillales bacterium]|jgi:agmatinase|nr:agmatinase family protein [Rhodospirillales bacterium]MBT4039836.1 agmatinase family protein [Rhodospirillales bacterium]MBT4625982.1 agmatinase family protein [Rhodospirillales bacterium]MBT5350596.1 agmatinase family protein [Rhodospirillales bacterium]MBT5520324.1 agmatinase family protein [Rhodospirillales bacterium]
MPDKKTGELRGNRNLKTLERISQTKQEEEIQRGLELGLEAADSINDRSISLFSRGHLPAFAGINTFMKTPYCEDIREVGNYEAAFVGAPFDGGTTYRPGTRFGPQGVRRISAVYDGYCVDGAVDLFEELDLCDAGDIFVIPGSIEKTFDQVSKAVSHIYTSGVFPIIVGGDHSLGYPNVRGVAPHIDGNVGIIHFDRHLDTQDIDMDERMHTTPWYWTTNDHESVEHNKAHQAHSHMHDVGLSNCPPKNLVQIGIGGWYGNRPGSEVARDRGTSVITMKDFEELGTAGTAAMALDLAWKGCDAVYLSFDIDSIDPGYAPGTGTPEPGGFTPREALEMVRIIAKEGLCAMEVVEVSPPYDVNDSTSQLACRVILDTLGTMVTEGKLGHRDKVMRPE